MALARHGRGPLATARALASQVHPVFMLPPVATSLLGATLAPSFSPSLAVVHATAIFAAVYTAHVKDGYVDFFRRGEDDDHPLTERGCRVGLIAGSTLFWTACLVLFVAVGPWAAVLTAPCWAVAYFHAPHLDTNPVTATGGYPTGIALSLLGGFYVQASTFSPIALGLAGVFLVVIGGIKIVDDATDYDYDRSIGKRTVAVALGPRRARWLAASLMTVAMIVTVALALLLPSMPRSAAFAPLAFGGVAAVARDAEPKLATMLLVRGSYLFLAALLAALWLRPVG